MPTRVDPPHPGGKLSPAVGFGAWLRGHPYTVATLLFAGVMAVRVALARFTEFEWVFVLSARNLVEGRGLYLLTIPPFKAYAYPPWMAVLSIPLAYVPRTVALWTWFLINIACMVVAWRVAWRLSGGGTLQGEGSQSARGEHLIACLGLACALPYIESGLRQQQTDLLTSALLMGGCLALARSRVRGGAVLFGLAAAMKCTPLLFAPYLAWRGRWRAAVLLVVVAVGLNLVPDLVRPPSGGGSWLFVWVDQFLRPMARPGYLPGRWYARILDNQSLAGAFTRWATTRLAWQEGGIAVFDRPHPPGAGVLRVLTYACEFTLLAFAWSTLRRGKGAVPPDTEGPGEAPGREVEWSVVLLLMLLFSPMSSRSHFVTLLLPALCVARRAVHGGDRISWALVITTIATGILSLPLWGHTVKDTAMWCGLLTWGALGLLLGCFWTLWGRDPGPNDARIRAARPVRGFRAGRSRAPDRITG